MKKRIFLLLTAILMAMGTSAQYGKYVGGDISDLPLYEASKTVYLDGSGNKISDVITWLKEDCGWNCFRVRLFVNPQKKHPNGDADPSVCQDIEYVKTLGKRIKDSGAYFMLDFHYSDTWVDATHIQAPSVCSGMTVDEKADWIYTYTKESLEALKAAGATPDLVQVGNEIMYGFMGIKVYPYDKDGADWDGYLKVLKQGCQAVRDVLPSAQIIIHTDRPTNSTYNSYYYGKLDDAGVPYDVIGLSYYPFWHGYLNTSTPQLKYALNSLIASYPEKKVQIVETAYNFQYWPSEGVNYDTQSTWACSDEGQYKFVKDLVDFLKDYSNVDGLMYWCPEEAGCGDNANWDTYEGVVIMSWINRGLWWSKNEGSGHWPIKNAGSQYYLKNFLDPTGISSIAGSNISKSSIAPTFDLTGRKVAGNSKGITIQNGQKVIR